MVLTKTELIDMLQNEVHILLHLITKIDPAAVDYRPTEKQRSTIELLRYLSLMGPVLVQSEEGRLLGIPRLSTRRIEQAADRLGTSRDRVVAVLHCIAHVEQHI